MFWNDDLVTLFDVWESLTTLYVGSGDARDGGESDGGFASGCGDAPLCAGKLAELGADSVHHLVELDEVVRRLEHGLFYLGKRPRSADDGKRAAAIDERTYADAGKEIVLVRALFRRKRFLWLRLGQGCAPAANGEAAVATPRADRIPDCLRTSRRDQRALRKRDMDSPFLTLMRMMCCEYSRTLDVGDEVDLDQGIPWDASCGSDGRADGGNRAPLAGRIDAVHCGIVLEVVEIDVHLQHLIH